MKRVAVTLLVALSLFLLVGGGCIAKRTESQDQLIGGQRDEHGCLGPAGYSWDEEAGTCTRSWEIDQDFEKTAAKAAAKSMDESYGLTAVSVEAVACLGRCFIVGFSTYDKDTGEYGRTDVKVQDDAVVDEFAAGEPTEHSEETTCERDVDCACGVHKDTGKCFIGNIGYVEDSKQCPDFCAGINGQYKIACVANTCKHIITEQKDDLIRLDVPLPDQVITSPLKIAGQARGYWYFEGSFPVKLLDAEGNEIASWHATAQSEWMTEDLVDFEATLTFEKPASNTGTLILQKDNPSDLPENDDELRIPVRFE